MSMFDKSYCATNCDQEDCERNIKFNKPKEKYYSMTTFDDINETHENCIWKLKKGETIDRKTEMQELKDKVAAQEEQLQKFIPRRRVRRVYKMLGDILEADTDIKPYVKTLKAFINKIEKEGKAEADQEIKTAIEHLLSVRER